jgi:hypothetical protein
VNFGTRAFALPCGKTGKVAQPRWRRRANFDDYDDGGIAALILWLREPMPMICAKKGILIVIGSVLFVSSPDLKAQPTNVPHFLKPVAYGTTEQPAEKLAPAKAVDDFGLTLPAGEHLFRMESEQAFRERLRRELPQVKNVLFPKDVPFVQESKIAKAFAAPCVGPIAASICFRPLYFEDKKAERYGQYVPCLQPLISTSKFYLGVLMLPGRLIASPPWTFECDNP